MLGAIFGDIVGSVYEFNNTHDYSFRLLSRRSRPTDDSCMTLAVAKALMETYGEDDETVRRALIKNMHEIGRKYPDAGYGGMFYRWLGKENPEPYNSFGNGSAMRVSPAGWLYRTLEETLHAAELTAEVTHNHPEGIKGAKVIAAAIFLARAGASKEEIAGYITDTFGYDLDRTLDEIRPGYGFHEICQKSCPEALIAFLEGENYEDVIRKAVSLGGDSDTIACMAGAVAEAFYGMPEKFRDETLRRLDEPLRDIARRFRRFYRSHSGKPEENWRDSLGREGEDRDPLLESTRMIEEMIEEYYGDPGEDNVNRVIGSILKAMDEWGHIYIPAEISRGHGELSEEKADGEGRTADADGSAGLESIRWDLLQLHYEDGSAAMPVFTSIKQMQEAGLECPGLSVPLENHVRRVLQMEEIRGMVINPGDKGFFLDNAVLEDLLRILGDVREKRNMIGEDAERLGPEGVSEAFKEVLTAFITNNLEEQVEKVWLACTREKNEEKLVFAVKTDAEDPREIFDRLHGMAVLMKVKNEIVFLETDKAPWPKEELIFERMARLEMKYGRICPVCGRYQFKELDMFEICPVCGWEDDGLQADDHDCWGGANDMSVNQAREAYKAGKPIE